MITGPAMMRHISRTLIPASKRFPSTCGNGDGGVEDSRLSTVHGVVAEIALP